MRRETKLMHYGRPSGKGPANPPIMRASTILHDTVAAYRATKAEREHDDSVLSYGRRGTSTSAALVEAIVDIEGGEAGFLYPSGVAALAGVIAAYMGPGDHMLVVDTVFPATRTLCDKLFRQKGIEVSYFPWDASDLTPYRRPETKVVLVESPGSQTFEIMDLPALCAMAKGLTVIADNTYGSGWLYRPLELGCDVSVIAGTKYLGGHADLMMGVAVAKGDAVAPLRAYTHFTGQVLSPDDCYACLRGMRTLGLRLDAHAKASLALAKWFGACDKVETVFHPALPDHPGHAIWQRDADGCNGLLTVEFTTGFDVEAFLDQLSLFSVGSSWGGFESLSMPVNPMADRTFGNKASRGPMARFHAGLEHIDDLIADLGQAMKVVTG